MDAPSTSGSHEPLSSGHAHSRTYQRRFRSRRNPGVGVFLQMDGAKAAARADGKTVIDLSVGVSDLPPPPEALQTLKDSVDDPATYGYQLKSQTMPLLNAATAWYQRRYGLSLNAATEALSLIGAQEGLAHLLLAVADPGDGILMTDVAYPSYFGAVQVAGLVPIYLSLGEDLLPHFEAVPEEDAWRAKVLLLNYPNNPCAVQASNEFFQSAIDFCIKHDILLVHDNPYVDQVYDDKTPAPSPLSLPGGRECAVELFSFAKSYHLGGFRMGFALGNADAIASLEAAKAPIDFNQYLGILRMGVTCLSLPEERVRADAAVWQRRAHALADALASIGWLVPIPTAAMYIWAKLPAGINDLAFCLRLVSETGVALSPGRGFGPGGHGHVRFALVQPENVLRDVAQKIKIVLAAMQAEQ